jgi:hypothetical protein
MKSRKRVFFLKVFFLLVVFSGIIAAYFYQISFGTWDLFADDVRSSAYDSLGESLLRGQANVVTRTRFSGHLLRELSLA